MSEQHDGPDQAPFRVGDRVKARPGFWFVGGGVVTGVWRAGDPPAWWAQTGRGAAAQVVPARKLESDS